MGIFRISNIDDLLPNEDVMKYNKCLLKEENLKVSNINSANDLKEEDVFPYILVPSNFEGDLVNGLLKDRHYRSVELESKIRRNIFGDIYHSRRIKGLGKYGSPKIHEKHQILNIKDDLTGFILGLLEKETSDRSFELSSILLKNDIETEFPEISYKLERVYYKTGINKGKLMDLEEAFIHSKIPVEKRKKEYVIQIDGLGTNYRLQDILTPTIFKESHKFLHIEIISLILNEVINFLDLEKKYGSQSIPVDTIDDYITFFIHRVLKNVSKIHELGGIYNRLTMHNICLDGRLVDIDTITGLMPGETKGDINKIKVDLSMLQESLFTFFLSISKTFYPNDYKSKMKIWLDVLGKEIEKYYGAKIR